MPCSATWTQRGQQPRHRVSSALGSGGSQRSLPSPTSGRLWAECGGGGLVKSPCGGRADRRREGARSVTAAARLPVMLPYLDALRQDGDALLAAARRDLDTTVPSCPGWTVETLVAHVARIYTYVAQQARSIERVPMDPPVPEGAAILDFFAEAHAALLLVLRETPADAPAWNWARNAPNTVAF